jgi:predicted patatin/cPLA2 family phospholipase
MCDPARPRREGIMSGTCLVLEGGAMRGNFTAGILDYLMYHQMPLADCVIGVSAGALAGVNYVSDQPGRGVRVNSTFARDRRFLSIESYLFTGNALGKNFLFNRIQHELDPFDFETFKKSPCKFYVVATNLDTGKAEYLRIEDADRDCDLIRASCSMPLVSTPVEYEGMKLLDGGTSDSIPVRWAMDQGYDKIIVVLTRERSFRREPEKGLAMMRRHYVTYPNYVFACEQRHNVYNTARRKCFKLEQEGRIVVLLPENPPTIKQMEHDSSAIMEIYNEGLQVAEKNFDRVREYVGF